ncbi:MAG TPA: hypothetical protein VFJ14_15595 [Nocardioidaceae bacterium]|nr:hypothetical protein [Nocardioidaceae bacterium]
MRRIRTGTVLIDHPEGTYDNAHTAGSGAGGCTPVREPDAPHACLGSLRQAHAWE